MNKCQKCNITVGDQTDRCPLCHLVLVSDGEPVVNSYPDARIATRRFRLFENIVLFLSIVTACILVYANYCINPDFLWSVLVGFALIYANVIIRLAIIGKSGYIFKTLSLTILAVLLMYATDYMTGDLGWSLNFVFPSAILAMDLAILILMIVNRRNWQSYMMLQITMILLSIIPFILMHFGKVSVPEVAIVAFAASVFIFLGTLIIGDRRAREELRRRFHV